VVVAAAEGLLFALTDLSRPALVPLVVGALTILTLARMAVDGMLGVEEMLRSGMHLRALLAMEATAGMTVLAPGRMASM
jgi:hypothetical protein